VSQSEILGLLENPPLPVYKPKNPWLLVISHLTNANRAYSAAPPFVARGDLFIRIILKSGIPLDECGLAE
jgi:hypothetical protein